MCKDGLVAIPKVQSPQLTVAVSRASDQKRTICGDVHTEHRQLVSIQGEEELQSISKKYLQKYKNTGYCVCLNTKITKKKICLKLSIYCQIAWYNPKKMLKNFDNCFALGQLGVCQPCLYCPVGHLSVCFLSLYFPAGSVEGMLLPTVSAGECLT